MRTHYCGGLNSEHIGDTVTVCGWVHRRRDHGGVIFLDLRDRQGLLQVVVDPDTVQAFATADRARSEWVMRVTGLVRTRPEGTVNPDMATGEIEVLGQEVKVLNMKMPDLSLLVECSKGTYIRSLARDLGEKLDSGAHLRGLRRTRIGPYTVEKAISIENFIKNIEHL